VVLIGILFHRLEKMQGANLVNGIFYVTTSTQAERLLSWGCHTFQSLCGEAIHTNQSLTKGTISCYFT